MAQGSGKRIEVNRDDTIVYRGMTVDPELLDIIVDAERRVLWGFMRDAKTGDVRAIPYTEDQVIWMTDKDVLQPEDVEL